MLTYLTQIQLASALLCLILAAQFLLMVATRPLLKRLLAVNYLLYCHQSVWLVAVLHGQFSEFFWLRPLGAMLIGPLLYVYFCQVQRPQPGLTVKDLCHCLAAVVLFAVVFTLGNHNDAIENTIIASFVVYFLLILYKMRVGRKSLQHLGDFASPAFHWLRFLMVLALINVLAEIAVTWELLLGVRLQESRSLLLAACGFLAMNLLAMLAVLKRSHWLEWMYHFAAPHPVKSLSTSEQQQANELLQQFERLIVSENLLKLEFGITLPQAARKLQVPARQLSNAINQLYGQSYSAYLNKKRTDEAQRLLVTQPELPVTEVMLQSGFSSKSNFNKAFLKEVGQSPTVYRQTKQQTESQ